MGGRSGGWFNSSRSATSVEPGVQRRNVTDCTSGLPGLTSRHIFPGLLSSSGRTVRDASISHPTIVHAWPVRSLLLELRKEDWLADHDMSERLR
jgi:hypothetical protein